MAIVSKSDGSVVVPSPAATTSQHKTTARRKGAAGMKTSSKSKGQAKQEGLASTTELLARSALQLPSLAEQAKAAATSYLWPQAKLPAYNVTDYWARWRPSPNHSAIVASSPDVFEVRMRTAYVTHPPVSACGVKQLSAYGCRRVASRLVDISKEKKQPWGILSTKT